MSPPIFTPDGSEVSEIVLPDGSTASEVIGPDGNVVFEAGPDIPDSGMFQNAIYQWWAGSADEADGTSGFGYPEELAGLSDATAVGGPILRKDQADGGGDTFDAGEYDGADDGHDWTPDSQLPTGDETFAIAALVWLRDGTGLHSILNWGDGGQNGAAVQLRFDNGAVSMTCSNVVSTKTGSALEGEWVTIGGRYDGTNIIPYANGSAGTGASASYALADANHGLGYLRRDNSTFSDAYVAEVILSNGAESDQAFSDYHADRLG